MPNRIAKKRPRKRAPRAAADSSLAKVEKLLQNQVSQIRRDALGFLNTGRSSLEKNIREQLATMAKRTTQLRRRLETQISKGIKAAESRVSKTVERMFKELKLPTQTQINALRQEMRALRRDLDQLNQAVHQLESSRMHGRAAS